MSEWNVDEGSMAEVLSITDEIYDAVYEINNCTRGCYTGCKTYSDLGDYLENLAERLKVAAQGLHYIEEDEVDDDEVYDDEE